MVGKHEPISEEDDENGEGSGGSFEGFGSWEESREHVSKELVGGNVRMLVAFTKEGREEFGRFGFSVADGECSRSNNKGMFHTIYKESKGGTYKTHEAARKADKFFGMRLDT